MWGYKMLKSGKRCDKSMNIKLITWGQRTSVCAPLLPIWYPLPNPKEFSERLNDRDSKRTPTVTRDHGLEQQEIGIHHRVRGTQTVPCRAKWSFFETWSRGIISRKCRLFKQIWLSGWYNYDTILTGSWHHCDTMIYHYDTISIVWPKNKVC